MSEVVRFSCPSCGTRIRAPRNIAGRRGKCPKCAIGVQVPSESRDGRLQWHVDTSDEAFREGVAKGQIRHESRPAFAKIVPSENPNDIDIDIIGHARCAGCGHLNRFDLHFFGAMGTSGCGCEKCSCLISLGFDWDDSVVWLNSRMVTISHWNHDLQLKIDNIKPHRYEVPPDEDENVEELVKQMNHADYYGDFPMHHAAKGGKIRTIGALLAAGDDINRSNTQRARGETPLDAAVLEACYGKEIARNRMFDTIKYMLKHGADPNKPQNSGSIPLHTAATDIEVLRLLISAGGDGKTADKRGWTPMHIAAFNGCVEAVELLAAAGADVNAPSNDGETPLNLAARAHDGDGQAVQQVLRTHGAKN